MNGGTSATCAANIRTYSLSTSLAGSGGGSVNSTPSGIACTSGTCQANFNAGTSVTLSEAPGSTSTFSGWSDPCTASSGDCIVAVTADTSVTATFNAAPKAMIGSTGYTSLATAYAAATNNAEILLLDTELLENLTMNRGIAILLKGGYRADYLGRSGQPTVVKSFVTIGSGSLTVDGLGVK